MNEGARPTLNSASVPAYFHVLAKPVGAICNLDCKYCCNGGCPKDRFLSTPEGEPGLNYLCAGYKKFFRHVHPAMRIIAALLEQGLAPADIMRWYATEDEKWKSAAAQVGRNDFCSVWKREEIKTLSSEPNRSLTIGGTCESSWLGS